MTDVIRVCLEEIDLCKGNPPFFLSLLGEQYGTVVETAQFEVLHKHKPDFEWLKNSPAASVTELEIIHAIFSRLEQGSVTFNDFDFKKRELDCSVVRMAHRYMKSKGIYFDSVRAAFWEGDELYEGAGFRKPNHIQIAILNPNCIKSES
jgi:hypothetical protein